jgi:diphosphomevalonate decarboxylase
MQVTWKSPSNIALIKYWGKHGEQLPNNPSLSLTLREAHTITSLDLKKKRSKKTLELDFLFEGEKNEKFAAKLEAFLHTRVEEFPWLTAHRLQLRSENSFPHSAGIASSASAMSALALCLLSTNRMIAKKPEGDAAFLQEASRIARLGSGSASRSIYAGFTVWGKSSAVKGSSDEHAIVAPAQYHADFNELQDSILIVSAHEKSVSSRAGHALMNDHPMAAQRYKNAHVRLKQLLDALKNADWGLFCKTVETEALELHALMMTSDPSFILMHPNTLAIIERIRYFRNTKQIPVCFTLDAGPNVHVIYPYFAKKEVRNFIQSELLQFCVKKKVIYDQMGDGPSMML